MQSSIRLQIRYEMSFGGEQNEFPEANPISEEERVGGTLALTSRQVAAPACSPDKTELDWSAKKVPPLPGGGSSFASSG